MRIWAGLAAGAVILTGCDVARTTFPVNSTTGQVDVEELAANVRVVRLNANNVEAFSTKRNLGGSGVTAGSSDPSTWDYRVGVGDVLNVLVWEHDDLNMPEGEGLRVQSDGTFFYPHVGQIQARGRSPEQIRVDLTRRLSEFIPNPQVEIRVASYRSQAAAVTGQVNKPSRQPLTDMPLTLLDAIDAAGGLTEDADPRSVVLRRGGRSHVIDLQSFLEDGVAANNPVLRAGDVVSVPRAELQEAYLLGQLVKQTQIDLRRENYNLTQALTHVGGLVEDNADARGIFVFRDTPMGMTVYQLDASSPTAYLIGTKFVIHPQDVIYVTSSPMHRWNRLISNLLPTIGGVRTASLIGTE